MTLKKGLLWCSLITLITSSCEESVQYTFGVVTREVNGKIEVSAQAKPLVLVRMQMTTFASNSQGQVTQARARLVYPSPTGDYRVKMDNNVNQVDLYYLAQGYKQAHASFSRTLGVGSYQFNVKLKTASDPKSNYYYTLKPLLSQYIVEPRFQMPPKDQLYLGHWLSEQEKKFYPTAQTQP